MTTYKRKRTIAAYEQIGPRKRPRARPSNHIERFWQTPGYLATSRY